MPLRTNTTWFGVVLGTPDPPGLAHFYERLLGWTIFNEAPDFVDLAPSLDAGYNLAFQLEVNHVPPVWPAGPSETQMQMHLDLEVDDLDEAVAFALDCGARLADFQPQQSVRVLIDPAGHPFCVYLNPDEVAGAEGAADADN